jgi:hypothetical protein
MNSKEQVMQTMKEKEKLKKSGCLIFHGQSAKMPCHETNPIN